MNHTLDDRFWSKVDKSGECWVWTAHCLPKGYGQFRVGRQMMKAHRLAWEEATGKPVPKGMLVCHHCDNPPCVRFDHLFVGTNNDNMVDMAQKGRAAYGDHAGNRKLTSSIVLEIRRLYAAGGWTQRGLAAKFGTSCANVCNIVNGRIWQRTNSSA